MNSEIGLIMVLKDLSKLMRVEFMNLIAETFAKHFEL